MLNLTVNQIMLLLDIYRGTDTQFKMGTFESDSNILINKGLVSLNLSKSSINMTKLGNKLVNHIKTVTIINN